MTTPSTSNADGDPAAPIEAAAAIAVAPPDSSTAPAPVVAPAEASSRAINPWMFVPVLYFMQFLPNGMVTSMFGATYKSLGISNLEITKWTGLAALPWSFKMFWGPLVDVNSTKRRWTVAMQVLLSITFLVTAGAMLRSNFFAITVVLMFVMATLSATHDIACDGLYLMSLDRKRQAAFSGVMAMFSRFGRLFVDGVLLVMAGKLIERGVASPAQSWMIALGIAAILYCGGTLWNFFNLPRPVADVPAVDVARGERSKNILRTVTIVATGIVAYYFIASVLTIVGHLIYGNVRAGSVPKAWNLDHAVVVSTWIRIGVCAGLLLALLLIVRVQVRGTAMADAFVSYVSQPGFHWILAFIVFYRFGEAMIFAMASLFILDKPSAGGMNVTLEHLGFIKMVGQSGGLILGGLLGGWWIAKVGLRKAFWPLVLCMHVPNLLYIWAAYELPNAVWLYPVVFLEAFGYGVGFAGYFVYLMHVAQRGKFVTSHYAIGTGLGALFITFATILAGIVQTVFGYKGVFVAACLFTIPGTLTLLLIPMDSEETKKIKATGDH